MSQADEVKQRLDEVQSLRERLGTERWQEEDWGILERVLGAYERLLGTLFEAQMTLKRLQTLLFGTRRRRRTAAASGTSEASEGAVGRGEDAGVGAVCGSNEERGAGVGAEWDGEASAEEGKPPRSGGHHPGSGRLGAEAYAGAERVGCGDEEMAGGQR